MSGADRLILYAFISLCCVLVNFASDARILKNSDKTQLFDRFSNLSIDKSLFSKNDDLLLFISITSGPFHSHLRSAIRNTWILPCKISAYCDYRFFVDAPATHITSALVLESATHNDVVFRNSCTLMNRHSDLVHYGNSPPLGSFLSTTVKNFTNPKVTTEETVSNPDYLFRRFYKIDWKVCFMRWCLDHNRMADYHLFVEDDSFQCTENILHQVAILRNISRSYTVNNSSLHHKRYKEIVPFRSGTRMYDGFDDSTTFMSREVAMAFAKHYGESGFNCSLILDSSDPALLLKKAWLSWGNSWISTSCNWKEVLRTHLNLTIHTPVTQCQHATIDYTINDDADSETDKNISTIRLNCMPQPLILHHHNAFHILTKETKPVAKIKHMCEYMLLVDKVKEVREMELLWNTATAHSYHDFSDLFLNDDVLGWNRVMKKLRRDEQICRNEVTTRYHSENKNSNDINRVSSIITEILNSYNISQECIFERENRVRRNLQVRSYLYGESTLNENIEHTRYTSGSGSDASEDDVNVGYRSYFTET